MWVLRGLRKGVLTTKFPEELTEEERRMMKVRTCDTCDECPLEFCVSCYRGEEREAEIVVRRRIPFKKSVHVFFADAGSCNACNREVEMLNNPQYDFHRLGIFFTPTPRHADILLVSGYSEEMLKPLERAYSAMPEPKLVVACGACAVNGLDEKGIRADVLIPGCPPSPLLILKAILLARGDRI